MPNMAGKTALFAIRNAKRLSQRQLADMIGASQVLVSGIESGRINPRTSEIQRIAECLGYIHSPDTLLLPYKEWVKLFGQSVVEDKILTSTVKVLED